VRWGSVPIVLVCALAIGGCGGSADSTSSNASAEGTSAAKADKAKADNTDTATKPTIAVPSGPPPQQLQQKELVEGTGAEAKAGDEVTVQYVGAIYKTGKEFDSSWSRNEPFTFNLGVKEVIAGWDQGIEGMKVGGRRELIVPPSLGYGSEVVGSLPANSTLMFIVDLLGVKSGKG
jgi:peptidylprolyl isomerase